MMSSIYNRDPFYNQVLNFKKSCLTRIYITNNNL